MLLCPLRHHYRTLFFTGNVIADLFNIVLCDGGVRKCWTVGLLRSWELLCCWQGRTDHLGNSGKCQMGRCQNDLKIVGNIWFTQQFDIHTLKITSDLRPASPVDVRTGLVKWRRRFFRIRKPGCALLHKHNVAMLSHRDFNAWTWYHWTPPPPSAYSTEAKTKAITTSHPTSFLWIKTGYIPLIDLLSDQKRYPSNCLLMWRTFNIDHALTMQNC